VRFPNPFRRHAEQLARAELGVTAPPPATEPDSIAVAEPIAEPGSAVTSEVALEEAHAPAPEPAPDAAGEFVSAATPQWTWPGEPSRPVEPLASPRPPEEPEPAPPVGDALFEVAEPVSSPAEPVAEERVPAEMVDPHAGTLVLPSIPEGEPTPFSLPEAEPEPEAELPPRIGALAAVGRVFVMPRSAFVRVAARGVRAWIPALILLIVGGLARTASALLVLLRTPGTLPATGPVALWATLAIFGSTLFIIAAAAWLGMFSRAITGSWDYGRYLSMAALAALPMALRDMVQAIFMAAGGRALLHPGLSALTRWTPAPLDRIGYGLLGTVDAFTIWTAVLLVVGAVVTSRFGKGRAVLAAILYLLLVAAVASLPAVAAGPLLAP
jgi:hypothetical protein